MAFATTNVKTCSFGPLRVTYGNWTGAIGDAAGSLPVAGGQVYLAVFNDQDGGTPYQLMPPVPTSTSGSVTTLTVNNNATVTSGTFLVIHV